MSDLKVRPPKEKTFAQGAHFRNQQKKQILEAAREPFLVRVLDAVVYPDLPEWVVVGGAVLVCVGILGLYLRRYLRRSMGGQW